MDSEQFNQIVERRIRKIRNTVCDKAVEYASGGDRLFNFKDGAKYLDCSPELACWAYVSKHLSSVKKMVLDFNGPKRVPSQELCDEKLGDVIVYMILLEALFEEEREKALERDAAVTKG